METPGIEPGTSRMRSERSTPELRPLVPPHIYTGLNTCFFVHFSLIGPYNWV